VYGLARGLLQDGANPVLERTLMARTLAFVPMILLSYVLLVAPVVFAHCWMHHDARVAVSTARASVTSVRAPTPPPAHQPGFLGS